MMSLTELTPNVSVGIFMFGAPIENYFHLKHTFHPEGIDLVDSIEYLYEFAVPPLSVFVDELNQISSVSCNSECIWMDINLIGISIDVFLIKAKVIPDCIDEIYVSTKNNRGQYQKVYDFANLGLQVWTFENTIVNIGCAKYDI